MSTLARIARLERPVLLPCNRLLSCVTCCSEDPMCSRESRPMRTLQEFFKKKWLLSRTGDQTLRRGSIPEQNTSIWSYKKSLIRSKFSKHPVKNNSIAVPTTINWTTREIRKLTIHCSRMQWTDKSCMWARRKLLATWKQQMKYLNAGWKLITRAVFRCAKTLRSTYTLHSKIKRR